MSAPKHIKSYEKQWMEIAQTLESVGEITLAFNDVKLAREYRLKFYGFRTAMAEHDPANPWLGALMETRATIDGNGGLHLQRGMLATLLRGMLEHTKVNLMPTPSATDANLQAEHEQALLDYLNNKPTSDRSTS